MKQLGNAVNPPIAKLHKCEASLKRWRTRLARALTAIKKLEVQRARLQRQLVVAPWIEQKPEPKATADCDDGLDIPPMLDRNRQLQTLPDPRTKEKRAERRAIEREKREAELTGKRRKMPLSGKAALDAIARS